MSLNTTKNALIIVDMQNDFCPPSGSLQVPEGEKIISLINDIKSQIKWDLVVLTQDWHPADHMSFHSNNKDKGVDLFGVLKLDDGTDQVMWPDHCVQGSSGAEFHPDLKVEESDVVVKKGTNTNVDSYSGFFDNNRGSQTELDDVLKKQGIETIYCLGVAYDYCVGFTALDGKSLGYKTFLIGDATRGVAADSTKAMVDRLTAEGVQIIQSADILS